MLKGSDKLFLIGLIILEHAMDTPVPIAAIVCTVAAGALWIWHAFEVINEKSRRIETPQSFGELDPE